MPLGESWRTCLSEGLDGEQILSISPRSGPRRSRQHRLRAQTEARRVFVFFAVDVDESTCLCQSDEDGVSR